MTGPVLPQATRTLLAKTGAAERHPGLQLDKFSAGGTQKDDQKKALEEVCTCKGDQATLDRALQQRKRALTSLGAARFQATTTGPLTLHLSRASALENAGICLHPLYGFVYLPASGLKGMARAWAETSGADPDAIAAVFGKGPEGADGGHIGDVIFHDAWPLTWPALLRDILTNHHSSYYQKGEPPTDDEEPVPVSFLAIAAGNAFDFAISARRGGDPARVAQAGEWLQAALCHRGAGAKTNAGYGAFHLSGKQTPPMPRHAGLSFETELRLVTPGFFAGADQAASDCDLRPASLRGLLRWWWRTLHAAHLSVADLKCLEAQIWGDTKRGGAVRVTVTPSRPPRPKLYDKNAERQGLRKPGDRKTVQGLWYATYGMHDGTTRRHYAQPGDSWTVRLVVRDTGSGLAPETILREAQAALWLLCRHGGIGSKARKGFGCFADIAIEGLPDLTAVKEGAAETRQQAGKADQKQEPKSAALEPAETHDLIAQWPLGNERWQELADRFGKTLQSVAKGIEDKRQRTALGTPRAKNTARYAAPYHFHIGKTPDGKQIARFIGFPAELPDRKTSITALTSLKQALDAAFGGGDRGANQGSDAGGGQVSGPRKQAYVDGMPVKILRREEDGTCQVEFEDGDLDFVSSDDIDFK